MNNKLIRVMHSMHKAGPYFTVAKTQVKDWLLGDGYEKVCVVNTSVEGLDIIATKANTCVGVTILSAAKDSRRAYPEWKPLIAKSRDRLKTFKSISQEIKDRQQADVTYLKEKYNKEMQLRTVVSVTEPSKVTLYTVEGFHPSLGVKSESLKFLKSSILHKSPKSDKIIVSSPEDAEDTAQLLLVRDSHRVRTVLDTLFGAPHE